MVFNYTEVNCTTAGLFPVAVGSGQSPSDERFLAGENWDSSLPWSFLLAFTWVSLNIGLLLILDVHHFLREQGYLGEHTIFYLTCLVVEPSKICSAAGILIEQRSQVFLQYQGCNSQRNGDSVAQICDTIHWGQPRPTVIETLGWPSPGSVSASPAALYTHRITGGFNPRKINDTDDKSREHLAHPLSILLEN